MTTPASIVAVALLLACSSASAQIPAGTLAGAVTDAADGAVPDATVTIVNDATEHTRLLVTNAAGVFVAAALPPGRYRITVEARGFRPDQRIATIEPGTTATLDVRLDVGGLNETVKVSARPASLRRDNYNVGGVVTRDQIERLPLNGRNFLELAKVEPGVAASRLADGRTFVSSLGAGLQTIPRIGATRITVDGASVSTPGTTGVLLQMSPELVQEFQIATVNFDVSAAASTNGAINVVTRSGTNAYRGGGFYLYRDHRMAAYPALTRDPANPGPFFEREQLGLSAGGPLRRGRAFFFANFERTDQVGVVSIELRDEFAPLGGIFPTPYAGNQFSGRFDVQLHRSHTAFVRHTDDRNSAFLNAGASILPSGWSRRRNAAHQTVAGLTSVLSRGVVNELRGSHFSTSSPITAATREECPGCFGLGEIRTVISGAGGAAGLVFGGQGSSASSGWRIQLTDNITWQKGTHTARAGFEWEHTESTSDNVGFTAGEITLFSPAQARRSIPGLPLPASFATPEDVLRLPVRDFSITVGSGTVLWEGFRPQRRLDSHRLYVGDAWRVSPRLTLHGGVAWSYEPNALSHDLTKPTLLAPILGADGLRPPKPQTGNFSPAIGAVWTATQDGRTVLRAGVGRYFDPPSSANALNLIRERHLLSPVGTGMLTITGANIPFDGGSLRFAEPTSFTGAELLGILPTIRASLQQAVDPGNRDLSVRNLDRTKQGTNLQDPSNGTPSALHLGVGMQREVAAGFVVSADLAFKRFANTFINGIDYNRWGSASGPVIARCTVQQREEVRAVCSNGPLFFDTTSGRARYLGLLVRAEKRFSGRSQLLASYALGSFVGSNGTGTGTTEASGGRVFGFNNDDWSENYGPLPTDQRHSLNVSGVVELPLQIQLAASLSAASALPFAPYVGEMDFNGDGTTNDLLPGTRVNQFGRSLNKADLEQLVDSYNRQVAGNRTAGGQTAPLLTLPRGYSFNDSFLTQDVRLSRHIRFGGPRHAAIFVEVFNLFNTANLIGVGSDLARTASFGRANARTNQIFGSGGPRAWQLGARLSF